MTHVIIGAGAAGLTAAKTIRELRPNDEIAVIAADDAVYSRCMLHKYISGERSQPELSFVPEGFFKDNNIRWISGVSVTGIDAEKRQVFFDGRTQPYGRLLIASGAKSVLPPIEGLRGAKNVCGLRDFPDAKAIRESAAKFENIVIIGAGLIGLDAAYGLLELGKKPVVVEMASSVLAVNLDCSAASTYQKKFEEAGCEFRLGSGVSSVVSDASGAVSAVMLSDGEKLPCDLLIVAVGVSPATEFLKGSAIATDRGVIVDEYLATSVEGVYAAGDVSGLSRNWPNAVTQGEVAAYNMCGVPTVYDDTFDLKNTINFFGIASLSVGQIAPSEGDVEHCRRSRGRYEKIITRGGVPVGVILQGDISRSGFWQYIVKNKINVASIPRPVWKLSFADSYGVEEDGEYKWTVAV